MGDSYSVAVNLYSFYGSLPYSGLSVLLLQFPPMKNIIQVMFEADNLKTPFAHGRQDRTINNGTPFLFFTLLTENHKTNLYKTIEF